MKTKKTLIIKSSILGIVIAFLSYLSFDTVNQAKKSVKENFIQSTEDLIEYMKDNNSSNHLKEYTFVQKTIRFNEDGSVRDTMIWHEAVRFPKEFRIDIGKIEKKQANLYRNDSVYIFRKNKLVHSGPEIQQFLILDGGIFYYSIDEALERLEKLGIDTNTFSKSTYNDREVYIIGSKNGDLKNPQIWIDAKHFYIIRRVSKVGNENKLMEMKYDHFKKINGYWIETYIDIFIDGRLRQVEYYYDIDVNTSLDDRVFDPNCFGKYYWFQN